MTKIKVLLCDKDENMKMISECLTRSDIDSIFCPPNPLDIQMTYLTEKPFAIMIESGAFNYNELIEKLLKIENPPHIYFIIDPFHPFIERRKFEHPNVHYIENIYRNPEIADTLKLHALDIFKEGYICRKERNDIADELVHNALVDLCFTANYTGAAYLHKSLVALCVSELKRSDSMCKTIYPYIAEVFDVTPSSVERSIRTVIKRCWGNSSDAVHIKYFGFVFSNKRDVPTNREFIMILGDTLIREMKKMQPSDKSVSTSSV